MMRTILATVLLAAVVSAAEFPSTEISNGVITARIYLPDAEHGYYRATRFDWSGVIASLEAGGHAYFGEWFDEPDPSRHDSITGPVEEFLTDDVTALGYDEAQPGGTFVKIGVGALRKPEEPRYQRFFTYDIVDPGKRTLEQSSGAVVFTQELTDPGSGYAYIYRKTVRLVPGQSEMILEHSLKNTGKKVIRTSVYNHNFFVIDGQTTGPAFSVEFPFAPAADRDLRGLAAIDGQRITYLKELGNNDRVRTDLTGFSDNVSDHVIQIVNEKTGAAVRITGDQPLSNMVYWSANRVLSPENYVSMSVDPGQDFRWSLTYHFYSVRPIR